MATWLFTWNPTHFKWDDPVEGYAEMARDIECTGIAYSKWSCGVTKSIQKGDRIFLIRLGVEPRGIVASGFAMTGVVEGTHWDSEQAAKGKKALRVYVGFDTIINHELTPQRMIPYSKLSEISATYHWSPYASGVSIPDDFADKLETMWLQIAR